MDTPLPANERELLEAALQALRGYGLTAVNLEFTDKAARTRTEPLVRVGYGGREATYAVAVKRGLRPAGLGAVMHHLERLDKPGLLVADYVTPPMAEQLRVRRVPFVDLAGNAYLERPPLFLWVKGQRPKGAAVEARPAGRAFQARGLQVLFALICHPEWVDAPYREIAQHANVAHGTVGWVMAELPTLGFVVTIKRKRRLVQRERLLQQWAEFYPRLLRPRLLLGRYRADTLEWWNTIDPADYGAVLGGEPAGGRITGHLQPGAVTFYAEKIDPRLLLDLRLRTDPAGNVEILRKFWPFINDHEPGLTPAPLIYADLMATGDGRCMETAKLIYDRLFHTRT